MKVVKTSGGAWLDKSKLENGDVIKLVSEAEVETGNFGDQLVAMARVKGWQGGAEKVAINSPSKNALIEAFGDDTKDWVDKLLTVSVVESVVGGKSVIILYLVPEGFIRTKDSGGYVVIKRKQEVQIEPPAGIKSIHDDEVDPEDIPF